MFDVVEHVGLGVVPCSVNSASSSFGLQRREEALHRCIVPDVAGTAHRTDDAVIGVMQQSIGLAREKMLQENQDNTLSGFQGLSTSEVVNSMELVPICS